MHRGTTLLVLAALAALALPSTAEAATPPQPQCMPVYHEYTAGPVKVVSPNSCTYRVYVNDEPVI